MIRGMVTEVWKAWGDSPHKVMFVVLVILVARMGTGLVMHQIAGDVTDMHIRAFEVVTERATWLAGVIAGAAKIEGVVKAGAEGMRGAFVQPKPAKP